MSCMFKFLFTFGLICRIQTIGVQEQLEHIAANFDPARMDTLQVAIWRLIARRQMDYRGGGVIIDAPTSPEHLPEAEPILPGHTLIRPALTMLKSAVKFPHKEYQDGAGVYGSLNNLGITYDGKNERLQYSNFRRASPDVKLVVLAPPLKLRKEKDNAIRKHKKGGRNAIASDEYSNEGLPVIYKDSLQMEELRKAPYDFFKALIEHGETGPYSQNKDDYQKVIVNTRPREDGPVLIEHFPDKDDMKFYISNALAFQNRNNDLDNFDFDQQVLRSSDLKETYDESNNIEKIELMDDLEDLLSSNGVLTGEASDRSEDLRRSSKKKKGKNKKGDKGESSESDSGSRYYEPNPGNPYTVHKNRYNQNYLWNLEMTGDHMNINPHAPEWSQPVPQDDLFTVRKWWYYNQDDYRPFRR